LSLDNKIAYQLAGGIERRRDRAVYKIFAEAGPQMIEPCQSAIFDELDKLKRSFLSPEEMEKYKSMLRQDYYLRTSSALDRALYLVDAWFSRPNLDDVKSELSRYLAVTPVDIVGIANRFFTVENSVILNVKTK
jgi:predicted Zn-dependent peptidase